MSFFPNKKIVFLGVIVAIVFVFFIFPNTSFATCEDDGIDCSQCTNQADYISGQCAVYENWSNVKLSAYPNGNCEVPYENCSNAPADCSCTSPETCNVQSGVYGTVGSVGICYSPLILTCPVPICDDDGDGICRIGDRVFWSANATFGFQPYDFTFSDTDGNTDSASNISNNTPRVTVTYQSGGRKNGTFTITNNPSQPTPNSCVQSITIHEPLAFADLEEPCKLASGSFTGPFLPGQNIGWSVGIKPGTGSGSYVYTWSGTPATGNTSETLKTTPSSGTTGATSDTIMRSYTDDGTKRMAVSITSGTETVTTDCPYITVETPEIVLTPVLAKSASCPSGACDEYFIDEPATFEVTASMGTGSYTYNWEWVGVESALSSTRTYGPVTWGVGVLNTPITYRVTVTSGSKIARAEKTITVKERLLGVSCTVSPTSVSLNQNQSVVWSAGINGGSGTYRVTWSGDDNSGDGAINSTADITRNNTNVSWTYQYPGNKTVSLRVVSLRNGVESGSTVSPSCPTVPVTIPPFSVSCVLDPSTGPYYINRLIKFIATPSGGAQSKVYSWSGTFFPGSTDPSFNWTPTTAGTYTANLTANTYLANGTLHASDNCSLTVTVEPPPPICGDGTCNGNENQNNCPRDCGCPSGQLLSGNTCLSESPPRPPFTPPVIGPLINPLGSGVNDIPSLIIKIADMLIGILAPLIVLFLIISGFMFIAARGNPAKLVVAKKALLFTSIGAGVIIGAWAFANLLKEILGA